MKRVLFCLVVLACLVLPVFAVQVPIPANPSQRYVAPDDMMIDSNRYIASDSQPDLNRYYAPEDLKKKESVSWLQLTNFPSACPAGQAITKIGLFPVCSPFGSSVSTDFNLLYNFPSACPSGYAVRAISNDSFTCVLISTATTDTNWQTSWSFFDANMKAQYRKYSVDLNTSANMNADGNISAKCITLSDGNKFCTKPNASPAGSDQEIQINSAGVFGTNPNLTVGGYANSIDWVGLVLSDGVDNSLNWGLRQLLRSDGSVAFDWQNDSIAPFGSVTVIHIDGTRTNYNPLSNSDIDRGIALLDAISNDQNGDQIYLSGNTFDIQTTQINLLLKSNISIHGSGKYITVIKGNVTNTLITPAPNSEITDLSIINSSGVGAGFGDALGLSQFNGVLLQNVYIQSINNGIVVSAIGMTIINTTIDSNFSSFMMGDSDIPNGSTVNMYDSKLTNVGDGVNSYGVEVICGTINLFNTEIIVSSGSINNFGVGTYTAGACGQGTANIYSGSISTSGANAKDLYNGGGIIRVTSSVVYDVNKMSGAIIYFDTNQVIKSLQSLPNASGTTFFRGDGVWAGISFSDTNWQNSWTLLDANLKSTFYTKAQTDNNFVNYYIKTQVDNNFGNYYTKSQSDANWSKYLPLTGGVMLGDINGGGNDTFNWFDVNARNFFATPLVTDYCGGEVSDCSNYSGDQVMCEELGCSYDTETNECSGGEFTCVSLNQTQCTDEANGHGYCGGWQANIVTNGGLIANTNARIDSNGSANFKHNITIASDNGNTPTITETNNNFILRSLSGAGYSQMRFVPTGAGWIDSVGATYIQTMQSGFGSGDNVVWQGGTYAADHAWTRAQFDAKNTQFIAGTGNYFSLVKPPIGSFESYNYNVDQVNFVAREKSGQTSDVFQVLNSSDIRLAQIKANGDANFNNINAQQDLNIGRNLKIDNNVSAGIYKGNIDWINVPISITLTGTTACTNLNNLVSGWTYTCQTCVDALVGTQIACGTIASVVENCACKVN